MLSLPGKGQQVTLKALTCWLLSDNITHVLEYTRLQGQGLKGKIMCTPAANLTIQA